MFLKEFYFHTSVPRFPSALEETTDPDVFQSWIRKRIHDLWVQTVLRKLAFSEPVVYLSVFFRRHTLTRSLQKLNLSWPQFHKKIKDFCRNSKELKYFSRSHWEMGTMRSKDFEKVKAISDLRFMDRMWLSTSWFLHLCWAASMLLSGLWTGRDSQAPGLSTALRIWKQDPGNGLQVTRTPLPKTDLHTSKMHSY